MKPETYITIALAALVIAWLLMRDADVVYVPQTVTKVRVDTFLRQSPPDTIRMKGRIVYRDVPMTGAVDHFDTTRTTDSGFVVPAFSSEVDTITRHGDTVGSIYRFPENTHEITIKHKADTTYRVDSTTVQTVREEPSFWSDALKVIGGVGIGVLIGLGLK